MPEETVQYLLNFMLRDPELAQQVGYTANKEEWSCYKLVIVPSSFWEEHQQNKLQLPSLPLQEIQGVPFLFGKVKMEVYQETMVIYMDLVASAFFLLSRMEENLNPERDAHGRFLAHYSLAYKAGFLYRPLVDEYGELLRSWLKVPAQPVQKFSVNLTHDVDVPFLYRTWRSRLGGCLRGHYLDVKKYAFAPLQENPLYTFPWLIEQDQQLAKAAAKVQDKLAVTVRSIYFLRAPMRRHDADRPLLSLHSKDMQQLIQELKQSGAQLGLHASYYAGLHPQQVRDEQQAVSEAIGQVVTANRNHYLTSREPKDFKYLLKAGITDDYTMGYADLPGFRLGTCRPVQFIRPDTGKLTSLVLHPLMAMEFTFTHYMKASMTNALALLQSLAQTTYQYEGELNLLWHNTSVVNNQPLKELYVQILGYLQNLIESLPKK